MNGQIIFGVIISLFAAKGILDSCEWLYFRVYGKTRGWGRAVIDSKTVTAKDGSRAVSVTVNIHGGFHEGIAKGMMEGVFNTGLQMKQFLEKGGKS